MSQVDYSRVMTTGSNGLLGSYIDFGIRTTKDTVDILDQAAVLRFVQEHTPTVIIHLAAATDTVRCESTPAYAFDLNARGTQNVALAAESVGAVMVYVSTSRVFDGTQPQPYRETDLPHPLTMYGKSKYLGELTTAVIASQHLIVRACWLFGGNPEADTKFFGTIIRQLNKDEIVALNDVYGSPTYAKDLIAGLKQLLDDGVRGTVHVCNTGAVTRADIVEHMLHTTKSKAVLKKVTRDYFPSGHLLPANESMTSTKVQLRSWQEALSEYLNEEVMLTK